MKKLALALCLLLALVGCQTVPTHDQIVNNDRPVAIIPPPPAVPSFDSQVDKLTPADINDPGKVGVAYKYDMTALRSLIVIYRQILSQYAHSSQNFDVVNAQIKALGEINNPAIKAAALPASAAGAAAR